MSVVKKMKVLALSSLALTLVSCGGDSNGSKKSRPEMNAVCDSLECMSTVDWKITLQGQDFPKKTRLEINGESVLDECMGKQQYSIDREGTPQSVSLPNYLVPRRGELKIKIVDQGWDCSSETVVLNNDNVGFELDKSEAGTRIVINL